jgi:hypothetical protein
MLLGSTFPRVTGIYTSDTCTTQWQSLPRWEPETVQEGKAFWGMHEPYIAP